MPAVINTVRFLLTEEVCQGLTQCLRLFIRNEMTAMSKRNATHRLCKLAKRGSHIGNRTLIGTDGQQRHPKFLRFSQRPVLNSGDRRFSVRGQPGTQRAVLLHQADIPGDIRIAKGHRTGGFSPQEPFEVNLFTPAN